jgi:hypothetical protein
MTDLNPGTANQEARMGDIGRAFIAATRRGELIAIILALVLAPLLYVVASIAIGVMTPFGGVWGSWPLSWFTLGDVAFAVLLAIFWQGFAILLIPRRVRGAMEAQTWIGERQLRGWQRATGSLPNQLPPSDPDAAQAWLEAHRETEANRAARAEVLLLARRFDEARATIARIEGAEPLDRIARADLTATADFLEGREVEAEPLRRAAAAADGDDRLEAILDLAFLEVRLALQQGGDWLTPLDRARAELGSRADGVLWKRFFLRRLMVVLPLMLVTVAIFGLLRQLW